MKLIMTSALTLIMTAACTTFDVKEAERTTSPNYDGAWVGVFDKTEPLQAYTGSSNGIFRIFNCDDINGDIKAVVSDGKMSGTIGLHEPVKFSSNISSTGRIYFELPKKSTFVSTVGENYMAIPYEVTDEQSVRATEREYHVLEGNLDASAAISEITYTAAYGMQHQGGCKYSVSLKRSDATAVNLSLLN